MSITLQQFIDDLNRIKQELRDKEIVIQASNGLLFEPKVKFIVKEIHNLNKDAENVDKIIITYE